jgi:hypothetical protein
MKKEKFIWNIASEILENHGDEVDNISIHSHLDCYDERYKIYCSDGYCFELKKEYICEPDDVEDTSVSDLQDDGYVYHFTEPWDKFKTAGINKAIELLNIYSKLKNE